MKHLYFGFLTVGVFLFFGTAEVSACICRPPFDNTTTQEEKLTWYRSKSVTVFIGKVISEKPLIRQISRNAVQYFGTRKNIRVDQFWGAAIPNNVFLFEGMNSCDARLFGGESYLIFSYQLHGKKIVTGACSGNIELKYAAEELKLLGEGRLPSRRKSRKHKMRRLPKK